LDGVACGTYLTVNLKSTTERRTVIGGNESEMIPAVGGGMKDFVVTLRFGKRKREGCGGGGS
jgi:hypothetical protein